MKIVRFVAVDVASLVALALFIATIALWAAIIAG